MTDTKPQAALGYVTRDDGLILCVWNRRYQGWGLPGGKVEPGETLERALKRTPGRELRRDQQRHARRDLRAVRCAP